MNFLNFLEPQESEQMSYKKSVKKNKILVDFDFFLSYIGGAKYTII